MGVSVSRAVTSTTALSTISSTSSTPSRTTTSAAIQSSSVTTTFKTTTSPITIVPSPSIITKVTSTGSGTTTIITATSTAAIPPAATESPCTSWEFITVRGANDDPTNPYWMANFRSAVYNAVPNGTLYELPYNAIQANGAISAVVNVITGANLLSTYTVKRANSCPGTKFLIAGFSQGAGVTVLGLQGLTSSAIASRILGVVVWGSPFWTLGRSENVGTATEGAGTFSGIPFRTPSVLQAKTRDFCLYSDDVCTGETPLGYSTHTYYRDSEWQDQSVQWMMSKLQEAGF